MFVLCDYVTTGVKDGSIRDGVFCSLSLIWLIQAESEGAGKGSVFAVELPVSG